MTPESISGRRLVGLFLLGCVLFNYPILSLFNVDLPRMGVPLLYLYLFGIWFLLIVCMFFVTRIQPKAPPAGANQTRLR